MWYKIEFRLGMRRKTFHNVSTEDEISNYKEGDVITIEVEGKEQFSTILKKGVYTLKKGILLTYDLELYKIGV